MEKRSLRPFGALVTGWLDRYRKDLFFRTDITIAALQIAFVLVILFAFWILLSYAGRELSIAIAEAFGKVLANGAPPPIESILADVARTRLTLLSITFFVLAVLTGSFGYLVARITREPARRSLERQKRFISDIAHELRTPLSIIRMNTDLALMDDDVPQRARESFEKNNEELVRISDTINNLLSLTALVHPERIPFADTDLLAIANDAITKLGDLALTKDVTIKLNNKNGHMVWGNQTALGQIVFNLIKNAVIYTPSGGTVTVTIEPDIHHNVRFSVQDTGIGIASEDLTHIFEPFYRAERSRTRERGGSGLGLAIVFEMVKLHRGSIGVQSNVGAGTTVTVSLPAKGLRIRLPQRTKPKEEGKEVFMDFS